MLDHRQLLPPGTMMAMMGGKKYICLYSREDGQPRQLASLCVNRIRNGDEKQNTMFVAVGDIVNEPIESFANLDTGNYAPRVKDLADQHHVVNKEIAVHIDYPHADEVAIVAPGRLEVDLNSLNMPIIAVSRAINEYPDIADYAVVSDTNPFIPDFPEVISAVFGTACHPDTTKHQWKNKTWYTDSMRRIDGIPAVCCTEGVITDALWFAVNHLKAKKVLMFGVEQPAIISNYFWEGIFLQAHCFWYSLSGVEIWNCTPATSVIAGVMLGTMEEALNAANS